jgi:hypothetical protein
MKKILKNKSFLFTFLIIVCLLFSSFFILGSTNKIHGVVPTKVTAHGIYRNIIDASGKLLGTYTAYFEFWNVGDYGDGEQMDVKEHVVYSGERYYEHSQEGYVENGYSYDKDGWKFSGGPNGKFEYWGSSVITMHIEDGYKIVYDPGQNDWSVEPFIIDNPGAFEGWTEEAGDDEDGSDSSDSTSSTDANYTKPTINLLILDGPVPIENGKVSYTIQAQATGNPEPRVEFSGVSQDRIINTGSPNIIKIDLNQDETIDLTATATNNIGTAASSITLVGSSLSPPTISLSVKGPVADEDEKNYSYIVEAKVTGNPAPQISFNKDDSGGSMGAGKVMIRMAADSEFIVTATAANSQGSASASVTLSTQNAAPELELKVIEGPVYLNIEIAYYIVQAKVKGFPEPLVVWENPSKTFFMPGGKNKKIVYVRETQFSDVTINAYSKNDLGKTETRSVNLKWEAPPEGLFKKRVFTVFDGSKTQGALFIKRANEKNWVPITGSMALYEGDSVKTTDQAAIIIASNSKGWIVLGTNTEFNVRNDEDGNHILVRQGKARLNLKNSSGQADYIIESNFGTAEIKGTDFVIDTDESQSTLRVIEGQVKFMANVSEETTMVSTAEEISSDENGFTQKKNFDLGLEQKKWEVFPQSIKDMTGQKSSGSFISNIQSSLDEGKIPSSLIIIIVFEYLLLIAAIIFLIAKVLKNRAGY